MVQENEIENGDAAFDEAELMLPPVPQVFLLDSAVQSARERWWTTPPFRKLSVRACRRPWSLFQPGFHLLVPEGFEGFEMGLCDVHSERIARLRGGNLGHDVGAKPCSLTIARNLNLRAHLKAEFR